MHQVSGQNSRAASTQSQSHSFAMSSSWKWPSRRDHVEYLFLAIDQLKRLMLAPTPSPPPTQIGPDYCCREHIYVHSYRPSAWSKLCWCMSILKVAGPPRSLVHSMEPDSKSSFLNAISKATSSATFHAIHMRHLRILMVPANQSQESLRYHFSALPMYCGWYIL